MSRPRRLDQLLSPGRIGALEVPNRIVMTPMGSNLAEPDGTLGPRIIRYYEERARGGVGLLIVGVAAVAHPAGTCNPNQVGISDDSFLPGLRELCERVHAAGARIAVQLQHAGKIATRDMATGRPMLVPSVPERKFGDLMNDMTAEEAHLFTRDLTTQGAGIHYREASEADLAQIVDQFTAAAERAQRAGFDAVELHAGHGYLLSSFLSPASNHRTDAYGGPLENRARLLVETIRSCKAAVGSDFPLWCRIDAVEYRTEGGITFEDALETAGLTEKAGANAIHVSAYADSMSGVAFTDAPLVHRPGGYVEYAAGIKRRVDIPVIAVGRIEPEDADRLIGEGRADFVAMGRKLLADPELPRKLDDRRPEDIRPCIYCYTCVGEIFLNRASRCAVNPASGRESDDEIEPAEAPRHVLVVGAGPAGMEAARVAALRGHRVTLCEKDRRPGGTALFSALVYPPNRRLVEYLEAQVRKLPIDFRLNTAVTSELVGELSPDVVLVAAGAIRELPEIPGVAGRHVLGGDDLRNLLSGRGGEALAKLSPGPRALLRATGLLGINRNIDWVRSLTRLWMPIGRRVVVLGGGLVGIELAEFLHARGRHVTVVEEGRDLAPEMAMPRRWRALYELRQAGVELLKETRVESIQAASVAVCDAAGELRSIEADSVVIATGTRSNPEVAKHLSKHCDDVRVIGDAERVGYLDGAMNSAARVAREI